MFLWCCRDYRLTGSHCPQQFPSNRSKPGSSVAVLLCLCVCGFICFVYVVLICYLFSFLWYLGRIVLRNCDSSFVSALIYFICGVCLVFMVPHISFWYLGREVLRDCGIFWVSLLICFTSVSLWRAILALNKYFRKFNWSNISASMDYLETVM